MNPLLLVEDQFFTALTTDCSSIFRHEQTRLARRRVRGAVKGFSLLELLGAITIVSVIAAITLPFVNRTGGEGSLIRATEQVAATVEEARTLAASLQQRTAVVAAQADGTSKAVRAWRSYGIFVEDPQGIWKQKGNWEQLPTGIFFATRVNGGTHLMGLLDDAPALQLESKPGETVEWRGLVFNARGSVESSPAPVTAAAPADSSATGAPTPPKNKILWLISGSSLEGKLEPLSEDGWARGVEVQPLTGLTTLVDSQFR